MAENNVQTVPMLLVQDLELSGQFKTKHVVADPNLILDLSQQQKNDMEKLALVQNYMNEIYEYRFDGSGPRGTKPWRVIMAALAAQQQNYTVTLILSDADTVTGQLRAGELVGKYINHNPVVKAQGQVPILRIKITEFQLLNGGQVVINWADEAAGSTVTPEDFGATINFNGRFNRFCGAAIFDNPPPMVNGHGPP